MSHKDQYPKGTRYVYSYFESRGGKFPKIVFFGLQAILMKYFTGVRVTRQMIDEAEMYHRLHFPGNTKFNRKGWEYILEKYGGRLPIVIKAVKEGTVISVKNVLMTVENTDPQCYWLTNYVETLLVQVWNSIVVCTNSYYSKKVIMEYLKETGDPTNINFKLHDFGYRGVSSHETAGISGAAHLVNFRGTDTLAAIVFAQKYYRERCAGFSIPASEHSTITSWGRKNEVDAMRNMLTTYPTGPVACVSDSYNIYEACEKIWGGELKDEVLKRDENSPLIIRPDSGDPKIVVVECLNILGEKFGYTKNEKGYKILDPRVRIIQGDGIYLETMRDILEYMKQHGWSADNIAFGSGGGLLQKFNRDTIKAAFKCSWIDVNGKPRDVFKSPVDDNGKRSKQGRFMLYSLKDDFVTIAYSTNNNDIIIWKNGEQIKRDQSLISDINFEHNKLEPVFMNGELLRKQSFSDIRKKVNKTLG